ncbi:SusD family protein [Pedobacter steynii]|uniref:SusD family protein n=1 Tax=Pedobacter steynii TaxID=430522 RepID=A0A1G9IS68_9SPHI|nr:RagB/SusD family nutrient uptake outer membrane protein [Pedobacter steynii]NQX38027.1 RagB/SusD family nutrient uptake outer membrane protein [Pedobacter steynii]SDL27823.1 SusD family protein [Pedobacter steynii]
MKLLKNRCLPVFLLAVLALSSCKKWLDVEPKTDLKQTELFSTEQGFNEAMVGAYVSMTKEATYGRELTFGMLSVMASDYSVGSSSDLAARLLKPVENLDYETEQFRSMIDRVWLQQFNTIAQVNAILENIDAKKAIFSGNKYGLIKGEALALRAYLHFDLLRMFAPAYIAKDDQKYMPYVTAYGRTITPLSTVEEILNKALADLDQAENLMTGDVINQRGVADRKVRMNLYAAKGLKARIYLYMGNKLLAFAKAKEVIDAKQIFLMLPGTVVNLDRSFHPEHLFSLYSEPFEARAFSVLEPKTNLTVSAPYYFTQEAKLKGNIFGDQVTDIRFKSPMMQPIKGFLISHKFLYQDLADEGTTLSLQRNYIPLMRLTEMYYIAAESAADPATALTYLNTVVANRGLLPILDNADLQTEIRKEYRKEFFMEGQLFYYYKRINANHIEDSPVAQMSVKSYVLPLPENEKIYGAR